LSRSRLPVIGSGWATIVICSVMPATDSRSHVNRGLGQREAADTSALAISIAARMARTRGLSGDNLASASASESANDCALDWKGTKVVATAAKKTSTRITPLMKMKTDRRG